VVRRTQWHHDERVCPTGRSDYGGHDPSIVLKYPQGEKPIVISASAHVVRNVFGSKDDLKAGGDFRAQAATKQPERHFHGIGHVGRDGARPF
jgi:hypothetical protein